MLTLLFYVWKWRYWFLKNVQTRGNHQTIFTCSLKKNVTNMSQVPILAEKWVCLCCCVESCNYKKRMEKIDGAEGETRTRMGLLPLDPESSEVVFANPLDLYNYLNFKDLRFYGPDF